MRRNDQDHTSRRRAALASACATAVFALMMVPGTAHADRPSPTAPAATGTYTVKSGDNLAGIARKLGVTLDALLAANGLTVTSLILPGATLVVPGAAVAPPTAALATTPTAGLPATTYVVQAGDAFSTIAAKHGLKMGALLKANNLKIDSVVFPGTVLTIPAGGTSVVSPTSTSPGPATPAPAPASPAAPSGAPATTYTVQPGDGLFTIANKHGLKVGAVLKANNLKIDSVVFPGVTLTIPAGGTVPATVVAPTATPAPAPAPVQAAASPIDTVIAYVRAQLGKPYQFNGAGPDAFDCSGLTRAAYLQIGISLPHQSNLQSQSAKGVAVDWRAQPIQAGDLVFTFSSSNTTVISHVGIAISATQWIHAPRAGDVVRIGTIPSADKIQAVRRFVNG